VKDTAKAYGSKKGYGSAAAGNAHAHGHGYGQANTYAAQNAGYDGVYGAESTMWAGASTDGAQAASGYDNDSWAKQGNG